MVELNQSRTFLDLKKNLKKDFSSLKKIRVALLGDSATQFLHQALRGFGCEVGFNLEIFEADYNQIERQILDLSSELYKFDPQIVVIAPSTQKLTKAFYEVPLADRENFSSHKIKTIQRWVSSLNAGLQGHNIIVLNYPEFDDAVFGNFSNKTPLSFLYQLRKLNLLLMDFSQTVKNLFICDVSTIQNRWGLQVMFDPRMYTEADMVYSLDVLPFIAKSVLDVIRALSGIFKKCLILDLDNTLWGGVIGDDGIENIQLGDLGQGKAFTALQLWIKEQKNRGIILAVCSKNDEKTAKEPFLKHPDMVLKLDDISVFIANWESKEKNIQRIKEVLSIGTDSMVFLDDNPIERNIVQSHFPDITIPILPEDPALVLPFLQSLNLFETVSLTDEDLKRTEQLQDQVQRGEFQKQFSDENDFLKSLEMKAKVESFNSFNIPRVTQLLQRSNQFNLRTIRHSEEQIKNFQKKSPHLTFAFSLKDKFGDYGLVSVLILEKQNEILFIDTWVMSCRVLNRGLESFVLSVILDEAKKCGAKKLIGEYLPTSKNGLVKDHYSRLGFKPAMMEGQWEYEVTHPCSNNFFIQKELSA